MINRQAFSVSAFFFFIPCIASGAVTVAITEPYKAFGYTALGNGERWDYVMYDAQMGRAYVAHGDHVSVVDPNKGVVIGEVGPVPGGTHGIAVSIKDGLGYTDDGSAGVAVSFDLKSLKILKTLPTAKDADGIVRDPSTGHIFVINGDSGSISVIDPSKNAVIGTITIGRGLEAATADGSGKLFVDGVEDHDVIVIDTQNNTVLAHFPMQGCVRPHGIAIDSEANRVFATCANKVMVVVDTESGANVAMLPIGASSDGAAFDRQRKLILSSNGDGTLSVIHEIDPNHFESLAEFPTAKSARTIAIDQISGRIFLPAADIAKYEPSSSPGGRPHVEYVPGSLKLLSFDPSP